MNIDFGKTLSKCVIDFGETWVISDILNAEFWQNLIISIVVILFNFFVIPLLKALMKKIKEKHGLDIPDEDIKIDKEDFKDKEEKK